MNKIDNDLPSIGEITKWLSAKTPLGILLVALAFAVFCTGVWILSYAAINFGINIPL